MMMPLDNFSLSVIEIWHRQRGYSGLWNMHASYRNIIRLRPGQIYSG